MERLPLGHAFDGVHAAPAHLAAGQMERVPEDVEQGLLRLAEKLDRVAVHRRLDMVLGHQLVLARSSAMRATRRASTPATWMRNSTVPRLSSIGAQIALAAASSRSCASRSRRVPTMAVAASRTSSTRGATAPSDTR